MAAMGQIAPDAPDPRIDNEELPPTGGPNLIRPQQRKLHDPDVSFEEYHYYAQISRAEEGQ
jgi:hypothetical protein